MIATERPWLDELLACPGCAEPLSREDDGFRCPQGHAYPVVGGVPRFVQPASYADSFGYQWTTFPTTQLDDLQRAESADAFRRKTDLRPEDVAGRTVLDAGCGMGRYADVVARWDAARVVATDLTVAAEAAAENLEAYPNVAVIQADLRDLPLAPGTFDVVFSIGVLHHTPDTFASLARIARFVRPGGVLAIWVYSRHLARQFAGGEVLRPITSRIRPKTLLRTIQAVQPALTALKRVGPRATRGLDLVLPTSNHPDPEWQVLETFDWYSPRYHHKHTFEEVEGWFRSLGFVDIERTLEPVAVHGRRGATP
jgi:2-polyprenyl-3-methyl-5-hydroxy-6-metoxy-1,4-benzoquinol methylase